MRQAFSTQPASAFPDSIFRQNIAQSKAGLFSIPACSCFRRATITQGVPITNAFSDSRARKIPDWAATAVSRPCRYFQYAQDASLLARFHATTFARLFRLLAGLLARKLHLRRVADSPTATHPQWQ